MRFIETPIEGAWIIEPELTEDERGFFARILDAEEFAARGLVVPSSQWSVSYNRLRGTLRGLHYQAVPHEEVKLVRCTAGALFDVIADPVIRTWFGVELTAENRRAIYVPRGIAHGFQSLEDHTEASYAIDGRYDAPSARGIRWDDPALGIAWRIQPPTVISARDLTLGSVP